MRRPLLTLVAVLALGATGCGKKGPPLPPPSPVPAAVDDLSLQQRGDRLLLFFTRPRTTVGGAPLAELREAEVLKLTLPLPPGAEPQPVEPRAFRAGARQVAVLTGAELASAAVGERLHIELPVAGLGEGRVVHTLAVRTRAPRGPASEPSNLAQIVPAPPPAAPQEPELAAFPGGIEVRWRDPEPPASAVRVFRRQPEEPEPGRPLAMVPAGEERFLDTEARFGRAYLYLLAAVGDGEPPAESALVAAGEILYEDVFPPPPPERLVALVEPAQVRLLWDPSPQPEVAGYRLYRSRPGEPPAPLAPELLDATEYVDRDVESGVRYLYTVTAVDHAGNESEPTPPAEVDLP